MVLLKNEEALAKTAINTWKLVIGRLDRKLEQLTDDDIQKQIAPGKNRPFYILGHLTAIHDRLFSLLNLGERLHPDLDDVYIASPDRSFKDAVSASDLRKIWTEVNTRLTTAFEGFTSEDWLQKHAEVSDDDFAKDPNRNRFAVVLNRTSHASYHLGQLVLTK